MNDLSRPSFPFSASPRVPAAVLGGGGYVAGELARLLVGHPRLELVSQVSTSQAGEPVAAAFPHLAGVLPDRRFESEDALVARFVEGQRLALFAATPHGETAALLDRLMSKAEAARAELHVVDLSADFRFPEDPVRYREIYGKEHGAPARLPQFTCAVPDHFVGRPAAHAVQPGCFTTAVVCAAWPFFADDLVEDDVFVSAITGSSGNGKKLAAGTHHPDRNSTLYAYSPLAHRHEAEMRRLLGAARGDKREPEVQFVPHSGPFVRGIHATLRLTLKEPMPSAALVERVNARYAASPFVRATVEPPKLTEVVGTNRCRLGVAARGKTLVVTSVIDNLVKGAAGGAVQWMNRLLDLPEDEGLRLGGLGWY